MFTTPTSLAQSLADILPLSSPATSTHRADNDRPAGSSASSGWQEHSTELSRLFDGAGQTSRAQRLGRATEFGDLLKIALEGPEGTTAAKDLAALPPERRADWIAALILEGHLDYDRDLEQARKSPAVAACRSQASLAPEVESRLSRVIDNDVLQRMPSRNFTMTASSDAMLMALGLRAEPREALRAHPRQQMLEQQRAERLRAQRHTDVAQDGGRASRLMERPVSEEMLLEWLHSQGPEPLDAAPAWVQSLLQAQQSEPGRMARLGQVIRNIVEPLAFGMQARLGDALGQSLGHVFRAGGGVPHMLSMQNAFR